MSDMEATTVENMDVEYVPVAGTISKIRVENFMCHSHMEVDLIDRVNFITGQNGSGKSAILTALTVAFGCNAKGTNRANTLKDFIKHGCSYALVVVELRNTGDDAFRVDTFGDKIIVERRITEGGTSTFTLKDSKGRKAMSGKNAVVELADHFNIDVDNPCVIMTQDKSREFLHSGSDKEKFQFFYKATQLEALSHIIQEAKTLAEAAREIGEEQKQKLEPFYKQVEDVNNQIKEVEQLEGFHEEIQTLKKQEAWAQAFELDKNVSEAKRVLKKAEEKLMKVNEVIDKHTAEVHQAEEAIAESKNSVGVIEARGEELKANQMNLLKELNQAAERKGAASAKLDSKRRILASNRKRLNELQAMVRQIQESIIENSKAQSSQFQELILEKEQELRAAKSNAARMMEEVTAIERDLQMITEPTTAARNALEELKAKHSDCQRYVNRLENESRNQNSPFSGPKIQRLQSEIDRRQSQFSAPPLGPIGAHLSLLEEQWAVAVEVACGRIMDTFVVNNMNDLRILKECGRVANYGGMKIIVYGFNNAPYNPSPSALPHPSLKTVKSVLQCESPTVMNVLIDHENIERQVLVEDYETGKHIAFDRNQRNVKECFMKDGTKMWMKRTTQATLTPQNRVNPRLFKNVEGRIATEKQELERLAAEKYHVSQQLANHEHQRREVQAQLHEAKNRRVAADRLVNDLEYELKEIAKRAEEARGNDGNTGTSELEADITDMRREEEDMQGPITELEAELAQLTELHAEIKARFDANGDELKQCQTKLTDSENALHNLMETKRRAEHSVNHYTAMRDSQILEEIKQADGALNEARGARQQAAEKASLHCSEEQIKELGGVKMSQKSIAREIKRLTEVYEKGRLRQGCSKEELVARKVILVRRTEKRAGLIESLLRRTYALCTQLDYRVEKLKVIIKDKKRQLFYNFNYNLMKRRMKGVIKVDMSNCMLSMEVFFADGANVGVRDTKSLSGGERSFTTLAYALALHKMTDTPFRAMDEFDIFMDAVARKISLETVIKHALSSARSQWIFITPHDISSVVADGVTVKKQSMHAPRS